MAGRTVTVLASHREPSATTNPYITLLVRALRATPGVELVPFSTRRALLGSYDVVHLHWPEVLMDGRRRAGRAARELVTLLLLLRLTLTRTPVVRTVHNVGLPQDSTRVQRLLLRWFDRLTRHAVVLNEHTPVPAGATATLVPHGHYRDWYGRPTREPVPGRLQYVGLVRRYKGVEALVRAFTETTDPSLTLGVAGRPSSDDLVAEIEAAAAGDPRISTHLAFLGDAELVEAVSAAELVVLPYRFMHNSGSVLAALSLDRPVLVPDNEVNRLLAAETGPGWVHTFEGTLTGAALERALRAAREPRAAAPDLSGREWAHAGAAHARVYRRAVGTPASPGTR
ncbi:glycosyl transferase [Xylanimonas oleitrophica]|uniref:Glycosyl transferase n=1 Tax=Xylanimonas oleitrophica TaxID=2607479 RepID=A0A2W5YH82_9MICO|nr:glycosyltransferase [Xylanimonas oleitrophica]PZR54251.1 glycosyl transferase [Xylanimonas oleitrophica]